jgi:hypothetical protein
MFGKYIGTGVQVCTKKNEIEFRYVRYGNQTWTQYLDGIAEISSVHRNWYSPTIFPIFPIPWIE